MMKGCGLNARHISTVLEAAGTTYAHIGIIHIMHHRNEASILQYTIWKAVINCRLFLAVSDEVADDEGGDKSKSSARMGESEGEDGM